MKSLLHQLKSTSPSATTATTAASNLQQQLATRRSALGIGAAATAGLLVDQAASPVAARASEIGEIFINVKNYGATGNGTTDDTEAIKAAIAALPADGGTIIFPSGVYLCSESLDLHGKHSTIIAGIGGLSAGAACASYLKFTAEGERFLNCRSTFGVVFQDLQIIATNSNFKGKLIDYSHDPTLEVDSAYWSIERCYLQVTATTEGACIYLDRAIDGTVEKCDVVGGQYGVQGVAVAGHYSNAVAIRDSTFRGQGVTQIYTPGEAWNIEHNTFEALASGHAGAIGLAFGVASGGSIVGNWFGDVSAGTEGIQMELGSGYSVRGNFIGGSTKTTAILIPAAVAGVDVKGNTFNTHEKGIAIPANTAADLDLTPNFYISVTTALPTPTGAVEASAGSGASVTVAGSDRTGSITLKTGEAPKAGALVKVNLVSSHQNIRVFLQDYASNTPGLEAYISAISQTSFTLAVVDAPVAATTYEWFYELPPAL